VEEYVALRNHGIELRATKVNDTYTGQAIDFAEGLKSKGRQFHQAYVDRFDGLVLVGTSGSYHFATPLCGYGGTGPNATATILEMFGFGKHADIMKQIDHGDDRGRAEFRR